MRQRDFTRSAPLAALLLSAAVGCSAAMAAVSGPSTTTSASQVVRTPGLSWQGIHERAWIAWDWL